MSAVYRVMMATMLLCLAACSSGSHSNSAPAPTARFQVVHASPDAPRINVLIDGALWASNLDYGDGLGEITFPAGSHTVTIQANTPAGPVTVLGPTDSTFVADTDYVIMVEGDTASLSSVVFPHVLSVVASTQTRVQFLNAIPCVECVADIYLTAPNADLATSTPFGGGSVSYQAGLGPIDVLAGAYQIRLTPTGQKTPVIFDSGSITLVGGADLVITALQNTVPGSSEVVLTAVDAWGNNGRLYDINTPANVRFVHDAANVSALDIAATVSSVTTPVATGLSFGAATDYVPLTPGDYSFAFTPTGGGTPLGTQALSLWAGQERTLYALGTLAGFVTEATWDNRRRLATAAKLRIVDGSPTSGPIDIYLTAQGAGVASATPWYSGVVFEDFTALQQIAAGAYDLTVTSAGTKTVVLGPVPLTVSNFGIYTVVIKDNVGGGAPLGTVLLDDFESCGYGSPPRLIHALVC